MVGIIPFTCTCCYSIAQHFRPGLWHHRGHFRPDAGRSVVPPRCLCHFALRFFDMFALLVWECSDPVSGTAHRSPSLQPNFLRPPHDFRPKRRFNADVQCYFGSCPLGAIRGAASPVTKNALYYGEALLHDASGHTIPCLKPRHNLRQTC